MRVRFASFTPWGPGSGDEQDIPREAINSDLRESAENILGSHRVVTSVTVRYADGSALIFERDE